MKKDDESWRKRICRECKNATPDTKPENMSIFGEPTLVICKHSRWKQNINQSACRLFE